MVFGFMSVTKKILCCHNQDVDVAKTCKIYFYIFENILFMENNLVNFTTKQWQTFRMLRQSFRNT